MFSFSSNDGYMFVNPVSAAEMHLYLLEFEKLTLLPFFYTVQMTLCEISRRWVRPLDCFR